jgi:hypothetical protein
MAFSAISTVAELHLSSISLAENCSRLCRFGQTGAIFNKSTNRGMGMNNRKLAMAAFGSALLASAPAYAFGDMGKAPTMQGTYVSGEGGYLLLDDRDIPGFGIANTPGKFHDVFVSPDTGWFAGGAIGYARPEPNDGLWFERIEGYAQFWNAEDSVTRHSPRNGQAGITSVDAKNLVGAFDDRGRAGASWDSAEGGLKFERDSIYNETTSITWVINPFIRAMDQSAFGACDCARRTGDVSDWMYGVVFAAEPEKWVTQNVALVGRLGAGFYGFNSDGTFDSHGTAFGPGPDPLKAHVNDSDDGVGFRGQLGAGLKFKLGNGSRLETFAEADYFSDVGTIHLPSNTLNASHPANSDSDDLWELRAGARLTFAISGGGAN